MISLRQYLKSGKVYSGMLLSAPFNRFGEVQPILSDNGAWCRDLEGELFFIHQVEYSRWHCEEEEWI